MAISLLLSACTLLLAFLYLAAPQSRWKFIYLLTLLLATLAVCVGIFLRRLQRSLWLVTGASHGANPFSSAHAPSPAPLVKDRCRRDAVLKQGFSLDKVPEVLDAIVVGEGAAGSCT